MQPPQKKTLAFFKIFFFQEKCLKKYPVFLCAFPNRNKIKPHGHGVSSSDKVGFRRRKKPMHDFKFLPLWLQDSNQKLGGGNSNIFHVHPENWGNDPMWRTYFSNGLVQPPSRKIIKLDKYLGGSDNVNLWHILTDFPWEVHEVWADDIIRPVFWQQIVSSREPFFWFQVGAVSLGILDELGRVNLVGFVLKAGVECFKCAKWENNQVVVSKIFYFHPYLGKWSNLTNIFQMGWHRQLDNLPKLPFLSFQLFVFLVLSFGGSMVG